MQFIFVLLFRCFANFVTINSLLLVWWRYTPFVHKPCITLQWVLQTVEPAHTPPPPPRTPPTAVQLWTAVAEHRHVLKRGNQAKPLILSCVSRLTSVHTFMICSKQQQRKLFDPLSDLNLRTCTNNTHTQAWKNTYIIKGASPEIMQSSFEMCLAVLFTG